MSDTPVVVLAGGRASRMGGGDKVLLPWAGRTLLAHVLARLGTCRVVLSANGDPARFASFGLPVLADTMPGQPGPLAGILAAMAYFGGDLVSVPGDTPLLPRDLVARLVAARGRAEIVRAVSAGRAHPVVALWSSALAPALAKAVASGERGVKSFQNRYELAEVSWPTTKQDPFYNINTASDLAQANPEWLENG